MKRILALLFLTVYLLTTTELYQLLKMPILIEHYIEHKEQKPELSFIEFLAIHYNNHLENHPFDDDYEQDKKLPFISYNNLLHVYFVYVSTLEIDVRETHYSDKLETLSIRNVVFSDSQYLSSIWQPPRFC